MNQRNQQLEVDNPCYVPFMREYDRIDEAERTGLRIVQTMVKVCMEENGFFFESTAGKELVDTGETEWTLWRTVNGDQQMRFQTDILPESGKAFMAFHNLTRNTIEPILIKHNIVNRDINKDRRELRRISGCIRTLTQE